MERAEILHVKEEAKCAIIMACARMLAYPDTPDFATSLKETQQGLFELGFDPGHALFTALRTMLSRDPVELAADYVSTFDLSEGTSLHLTAHELGDSRERGPALLELAQMYRIVGLVHEDDQLSDYLPYLLEMLTVAIDEHVDATLQDELETRIAKVCRKVRDQLDDSVYRDVFAVLTATLVTSIADGGEVPSAPSYDDEENMPYPLQYE